MNDSSADPGAGSTPLAAEIEAYYAQGGEAGRLFKGFGPLELARTRELIQRYFPPPPAVIYDIGGGPGIYACWLARLGYEVHLFDAMPLHVEQAAAASTEQPDFPLAACEVADARRVPRPDETADAVLLQGPLYHLLYRLERLAALRESRRLLKPGGVMFAVAISRYASAFAGLTRWWLQNADFMTMMWSELVDGRHLPQPKTTGFFTTAFFHRPSDLSGEVRESGFASHSLLPVEGPGCLVPDFETRWQDPKQRALILATVRLLEEEEAILGVSPLIAALGQKPGWNKPKQKLVIRARCKKHWRDWWDKLGIIPRKLSAGKRARWRAPWMTPSSPLEQARTKELIQHYFPPPPAVIYDIGGGSGVYACWLARLGYEVHLFDVMPQHVEQAAASSAEQPDFPLAACEIADVRHVPRPEESADAVLLHGLQYDLLEREQRLNAMRESMRLLKPGGEILTVIASRFASAFAGLIRWWLQDAGFMTMVRSELVDARRLPPSREFPLLPVRPDQPGHPLAELMEAEFGSGPILAVEGPGWLVPDLDTRWHDPEQRDLILETVRMLEHEGAVLGISPHIAAVGSKARPFDKEPMETRPIGFPRIR